jgi:hypothetical protein
MSRVITGVFQAVPTETGPLRPSKAPSVTGPGFGSHPPARLLRLSGPRRGSTIELSEASKLVLGREEGSIDPEETRVSRVHGCIEFVPERGRYFLTDLGSTNGTRLNGQPIAPHQPKPLDNGDYVALADCIALRFVAVAFHGYHSAFISYGRTDTEFAAALFDDLAVHGVVSFFFPETASPGVPIHQVLYEGITTHDRVVVVCSEESLSRKGVLTELEMAFSLAAELASFDRIIPIRLDDYLDRGTSDLCRRLRALTAIEFVQRGPARLPDTPSFEKLLRALRRKSSPSSPK